MIEKNSKNILIYYQSLRSFLIFSEILKTKPELFDVVIQMPALPYSRKSNKRNYKKYLLTFIECPQFIIMQFMVIHLYSLISYVSRSSIKQICRKNNIEHCYYEKMNKDLMQFIKNKNPYTIINNTSSLVPKELIEIPPLGVINFHEAPLPRYRGSASYFWFLVNGETDAFVSCHYVVEELDAGEIIFLGSKVKIDSTSSVFSIWKKMLLSHQETWSFILPFLSSNKKPPSFKQSHKDAITYSYPTRSSMKILKSKHINFFHINDLLYVLKVSFTGKIR